MTYYVRSTDGADYVVGRYLGGRWIPGTREDALTELRALNEPGAYVWGVTER